MAIFGGSFYCFLANLSHQVEVVGGPCLLLNIRMSKYVNKMRL